MPNSQQSTLKETSPHGRCKWPKSRQPEKLGTPETAAQQEDSDYLSHDYWVTGEVRIM
jgi:hypothetical protein